MEERRDTAAYIKDNVWENIYLICLFIIIALNIIFVALLEWMPGNAYVSSSEYILLISLVSLGCTIIALQCKMLYKYIFLIDIKPIFCLYVSKIFVFADIYLLLFKIDPQQFNHPNNVLVASATYKDITFTLLNYSASLQTLTGISSVTPRKTISEFLSATQVLCLGICYSVFIVSSAVLRFAQTDVTSNIHSADINDLYLSPWKNPLLSSSSSCRAISRNPSIRMLNVSVNNVTNTFSRNCIKTYLKFAKFYYRFMLLILLCLQVPRVVMMYYICDLQCEENIVLWIGVVLDSVLLALCVVCVIMRMRLIKRFGIRLNISLFGLITSYLSVLIQFGLLYFDIWIVTKNRKQSAFNVIIYDDDNGNTLDDYWLLIGHFLYFSTTTFTNVGADTTIETLKPVGQILNSIQMLLGIVFHTVVFGVSLLDISSQRTERYMDLLNGRTPSQNLEKTKSLSNLGLIPRQLQQIVVVKHASCKIGSDRSSNADSIFTPPKLTGLAAT